MTIEELLEKPYWIIDILPKRVPKDSPGQYFTIEGFFLIYRIRRTVLVNTEIIEEYLENFRDKSDFIRALCPDIL